MADTSESAAEAAASRGAEPVVEPHKLCILVVADADGDRLIEQIVGLGLVGTKIGSTGGFLRRGSSTVLSAVPENGLSRLVAMLHREFPVRTEVIPAHQLPYWDEQELAPETVEVRVGGAVMFVLDIDRFERD